MVLVGKRRTPRFSLQLTAISTRRIIPIIKQGGFMEGLFQPLHLIVILVIVLIIFGPGKLPELGEGLGKSIRAFKKAMKDEEPSAAKSIEHKEEKKA
jgi:sec-independent protein translocase protein TatA